MTLSMKRSLRSALTQSRDALFIPLEPGHASYLAPLDSTSLTPSWHPGWPYDDEPRREWGLKAGVLFSRDAPHATIRSLWIVSFSLKHTLPSSPMCLKPFVSCWMLWWVKAGGSGHRWRHRASLGNHKEMRSFPGASSINDYKETPQSGPRCHCCLLTEESRL